jgi:hypothetical protein
VTIAITRPGLQKSAKPLNMNRQEITALQLLAHDKFTDLSLFLSRVVVVAVKKDLTRI